MQALRQLPQLPQLLPELSTPLVDPKELISLYTNSEVARVLGEQLRRSQQALAPLADQMRGFVAWVAPASGSAAEH